MGTGTIAAEGLNIRILGDRRVAPASMEFVAEAPTSPVAYTFGWDSVFAIRITDVNRELKKPGVCPTTFSASYSTVCTAAGDFGPWQIAFGDSGGDGTILRMKVPITSGTMKFNGSDYDLAGSVGVIDVELEYLPQPEVSLPSGTRSKLVVRAKAAESQQPAVNVTDFQNCEDLVRALMIAAMNSWFNDNIMDFAHVFSTVDLNVVLENQSLQWLAPTHAGYAYHNGPTEEESYLGILSLTTSSPSPTLTSQISPAAIPSQTRAGFLLQLELYFKNILIPGLPSAFKGSKVSDFKLGKDGASCTNTNDIKLDPVKHDGTTYHPVLKTLTISVDGNGLLMQTLTKIPISPGIDAYAKQETHHQIKVVTKKDGTQTLTVEQMGQPVSDHWTDVSTGVKIIEAVVIIIAIIVDAVLTVLTAGAASVLAIAIIGLVLGLAAATPELIAAILGNSLGEDAPDVSRLVTNATKNIQWNGAGAFLLSSARFSGSFQMGGNPQFAMNPA